MFLGFGDDERGQQLRGLETFIIGYFVAVQEHRGMEPVEQFSLELSKFIDQKTGWGSGELGPIGMIRYHIKDDNEVWSFFWEMLDGFRAETSGRS